MSTGEDVPLFVVARGMVREWRRMGQGWPAGAYGKADIYGLVEEEGQ